MPKRSIRIELPSSDKLTAGLTLHAVHPPLKAAEEALERAEAELEAAKAAHAEAALDAEHRLPEQVRIGAATPADLEAAIVRQRATALVIPGAEQSRRDAKDALGDERRLATQALKNAALARGEVLRQAAAEIAPVLEELRTLETELAKVGDPYRVHLGVKWPRSNLDSQPVFMPHR